jgi:hypothetical protein
VILSSVSYTVSLLECVAISLLHRPRAIRSVLRENFLALRECKQLLKNVCDQPLGMSSNPEHQQDLKISHTPNVQQDTAGEERARFYTRIYRWILSTVWTVDSLGVKCFRRACSTWVGNHLGWERTLCTRGLLLWPCGRSHSTVSWTFPSLWQTAQAGSLPIDGVERAVERV